MLLNYTGSTFLIWKGAFATQLYCFFIDSGSQSHVKSFWVITYSAILLISCTWAKSKHLIILSTSKDSSEVTTSGWFCRLTASMFTGTIAMLSGKTRFTADTMSSVRWSSWRDLTIMVVIVTHETIGFKTLPTVKRSSIWGIVRHWHKRSCSIIGSLRGSCHRKR